MNRKEKIKEILRDLAARFLSINSNKSSLMTVTSIALSKDEKMAIIFFTVFPASLNDKVGQEKFEKTALEFAKRKRSDFKEFIKENAQLGKIPQIDFEIDLGEKNRQKIDNLLNSSIPD